MTQSRQGTSVPETKRRATFFQSIITGSVAGGTEVMANHPLWTIKTRLQSGDSFTIKPSILYRGLLPNAASMMPITALQVGLNSVFQNMFFDATKLPSNRERVTTAFFAGAASALVSAPTEMVMTYQGKAKTGFTSAFIHVLKQGGVSKLFTALPATAMRDGIFTAFFLGVTPIVKKQIKPFCKNDHVASVAAGITAGVTAAVVSQGVDTIKTAQQTANAQLSFKGAAKKIYSTHGIYGFFKGGLPRGLRVMSAVTLMGIVTEKMENTFGKK